VGFWRGVLRVRLDGRGFESCWLGRGEMFPSGLWDTENCWWAESSLSLRIVGGQRVV